MAKGLLMPVEFSRLEVRGYRQLRNVQLLLNPFNVLIGANGIGKSSILEVMSLLAASADGRLDHTMSQVGGISSILTQDGSATGIDLLLERPPAPERPLTYALRLLAQGTEYIISSESLSRDINIYVDGSGGQIRYLDKNKGLTAQNWDYKPQETALSQVPKMFTEAEEFRHLLASATEIYHTLDVSFRAPIRTTQSLRPADTPGKNGEALLSCLYALREDESDRYEAVMDALRVAFPTFEKLDLPTVATGQVTLCWKDRNFTNPLYPHELSEGTLRFLWLVTLLQSPGLPKVTLIDEPEVSLHPEMLQLLTELMREASSRTQLIVATHSDRFVRFLKPEELIVCDLDEEGGTSVKRADELDLDKWLADYALDELWSMGRLGGRS
jgi:predicted ATPase